MTKYDTKFYQRQQQGSYESARIVLGFLRQNLTVASACDVGCGAGTWIKALLEDGVPDVMGFDGAYAEPTLMIPKQNFTAADLSAPLSAPRRYDLAISLEVAEHLPRERSAGFVADLTRLAPAVLFSAAVPFQGGTDHVNERWQGFWVEEFARYGYIVRDLLRPLIWEDRRVEPWYRQNTLLFLAADHPQATALATTVAGLRMPRSLVHPDLVPSGMGDLGVILRMAYWWAIGRIKRILA